MFIIEMTPQNWRWQCLKPEWGNFFVTQNSDLKRQKTDKFDNIKTESFSMIYKHQEQSKKNKWKTKGKKYLQLIKYRT